MSVGRPGSLKIIGGKWRGRKVGFPGGLSVRPTLCRVRETVFNWLAPYIQDARCLDLFAGSGALGFEAVSRGAGHVTFVDHSVEAVRSLKQNAKMFGMRGLDYRCHCESYPFSSAFLTGHFDVVFLDPPYTLHCLPELMTWLAAHSLVSSASLVYVEFSSKQAEVKAQLCGVGWQIVREKSTRSLCYALMSLHD